MDQRIPIKKIGTILNVNNDGYIVSKSNLKKIHPPWSLLVTDIVNEYKKNHKDSLHSIYVKGSIARGTPIPNISDIDTLTLFKGDVESLNFDWMKSFITDLEAKYPFCTGFDLVNKSADDVITGKNKIAPILLKTMGVCVDGTDLIPSLPNVKPGKGAFITTWGYRKFINKKINLLNTHNKIDDLNFQCKWIMKRILRTGFELVMERSQYFTKDLYPCYEIFSNYYPEKREEMKEVLFFSINNTASSKEILRILSSIGIWIADEIETTYEIRTH
jgi:predicted nucleotidyltransferase